MTMTATKSAKIKWWFPKCRGMVVALKRTGELGIESHKSDHEM